MSLSTTKQWCCYILANNLNNKSYVGASNFYYRRFRAHSGLVKGGAHQTSLLPAAGRWHPICQIIGFPTKRDALQFELSMKQKMSKYRTKNLDKDVLKNIRTLCNDAPKKSIRVQHLLQSLSLAHWTSNAVNSETVHLTVVWYIDAQNDAKNDVDCPKAGDNIVNTRYRPRDFGLFLETKPHLGEILHPGIIDDCTVQIYSDGLHDKVYPPVCKPYC
jgi:predicted GIY-YIG superfamily endonuclease